MLKTVALLSFIGFLTTLLNLQPAHAWGERGHHALCSAATKLVKQKNLMYFLDSKNHMMGHVCNIPDIHWRNIKGNLGKSGDDAHFMNFENLDYTAETTPLKWEDVLAAKQGKHSEKLGREINVEADLGSSWWRYEQFYKDGVKAGADAQALEGGINQQNRTDPVREQFNTKIYEMLTNMGLMGHFVGDAGQPFHNTTDYDGWDTNQGGIHSFYESAVVVEMGLGLEDKILARAKKIEAEVRKEIEISNGTLDPVKAIRFITIRALKDLEKIRGADKAKMLEPSKIDNSTNPPKRIKAKRPSADKLVKAFEATIVNEMAASALVLAMSWDSLYTAAQTPKLSLYSSFQYPLMPDFVKPNYSKREPSSVKKSAPEVWFERNHSCEEHP